MLLIFDLDDTLIPTSKKIIPIKLRKVLMAMIEAGLEISYEEGLSLLSAVKKKIFCSEAVIKKFVQMVKGSDVHIQIGLSIMKDSEWDDDEMVVDDRVVQIVRTLSQKHNLAIVTRGDPFWQHRKMQLFGISPYWFVAIIVTNIGQNKAMWYKKLVNIYPGPFLVAGNRVMEDLWGVKSLGGVSIYVCRSKDQRQIYDQSMVDYEVHCLSELDEITGKML